MNPTFLKIVPLVLASFTFHAATAQMPDFSKVPGIIVTHSPASSGQYLGSPSIAILPNGDYVASHDFFGPKSTEHVSAISRIFRSSDKGKNWKQVSEINGQFWSKLFVHQGNLYLMGTNRHHGNTIIRKSTDNGATWTTPSNGNNGLLKEGEYHCAPMPLVEHNGKLWRAMEDAAGPPKQWGKRYSAFMMSIPLDADPMIAANWTSSNIMRFDSTYLNGHFTGWLEGNAVLSPDGSIVDILRVDDKTALDEKAAIVKISADGEMATFDPNNDFIPFPGGSKKFAIRYDPKSKRYWTISNYIPDEVKAANPAKSPASIRNSQALFSSADLRNWTFKKQLLHHPDVAKHGFQYVDWLFEAKNIIFLSRTAFDDGLGGAHNNHDANFMTFHRIKNFRKMAKK
ncbi:sialidase family protein [Dyadobacter sp. CY323]|uniref:sialidase family protein n=1 Tax=Dyadobacter sp. CY323 TaxID=2907302 RepID=UPI001F3E8BF1|nr:sialidase family protein [Dyadobacter sp. CY323]MCE6988018.1 glycoside hydrolase [Dyadobacter sp. CY323]